MTASMNWSNVNPNHRGQHPDDEDGPCFGCKIASIQFASTKEEVKATENLEATLFDKDRAAYKRLRHEHGLQPRAIKGCAELEKRANTQYEIEMGHLVDPALWKKVGPEIEDAQHIIREASTVPNTELVKEMGEARR